MDGMADYVRTPSRLFPDAAELDMAFLSGEKARSLGLHPLVPQQHPFAGGSAGHPASARLPPMPLATIQQHLFALQQRAMPPVSSQPVLPLPFPHGFLSQWTLAAAAGFGLNQLGLFGLGALPPGVGAPSATSPPQAAQLSPRNSSLEGQSANLKASTSPSRHRFSPYPMSSKVNESERPPSAKSVLDVSK